VTPGRQVEKLTFSKRAARYKVRKGDTVLSIADDFGVPAERLRKWNHLRGNSVKAGRVLRIYRPSGDTEEEASTHRSTQNRGKKATVADSRKGLSDSRNKAPEIAAKSKHATSLQAVSSKTVEQASESASLTRNRFEQGLALPTQLIDAETALVAARVRRAETESDERIAVAALRKALALPQLDPQPPAR